MAAILAADVAKYTRLMEADEAGTVDAWRIARDEVIDPSVATHHGRIVKLTGDGFLAEFSAVDSAVKCALAMQKALLKRFGDVPAERRMTFRMGINLGDIYVDNEDIYGDGVNLAARLESLAEPGGICISGDVYNQIRKKIDLAFEDMGEQRVKHVAAPVQVYRLTASAIEDPASARNGSPSPDKIRPTIAILPFTNMSGDPEQEFFADGLTEDIITELSWFRDLFVISRHSAFVYKGKSAKIQDVARDLGVQYVVEGSVRKAGDRVRVTVQLIEANSDRHIWAERYDRELEDIFTIQDEVSRAIVATLPARVEAATHERIKRKPTDNMAAYECVLAGKVLHHRSTRQDNAEALRLLERAIELDPDYAHAYAWKACVLGQTWSHGWYEDDPEPIFKQVVDSLHTALSLDDSYSDIHRILAAVHVTLGDHDKAMYHQERALSLNPNDDLVVVQQGEILTWLGRPGEGTDWIKLAMRLNPYHPERFWNHLGRAYHAARRYEEAIDSFKHITEPDYTHHAFLAACYARAGDDARAQTHAREVVRLEPGFKVEKYLSALHYKHADDLAHHREGLVKAGLPE